MDVSNKSKISFDASRNTKSLFDYDGKTDDVGEFKESSDLEQMTENTEEIFASRESARIVPPDNPLNDGEWQPKNEIEKRFRCPMSNIVATKKEFAEWKEKGWC